MSPPENEFPASVGLAVLLGRTDDAAVGISRVEAFSTGFRFTLAVRLRRAGPELAHGRLFALIGGRAHGGFEVPLEDRLLLGFEYSDGRRASNLDDMRMAGPGTQVDDAQPVLIAQGGGSGQLTADQAYWMAPLPPEGPVTVVLAWPRLGMPESRTLLDSGDIKAAAGRSQVLWPPQAETKPTPPPPPPRPSSGWFAYGEG
jgi:hypothetical protein